MPAARIHEAIAMELNKEYHMNELLLRLGSVAPDSWRNSNHPIATKQISHFWDYRIKEGQANNYDEFYFKYYNKLNNPFYFGYLVHLITDQYWKTYIDPRYYKIINNEIYCILKDGSLKKDENHYHYHENIKIQKELAKKYDLSIFPLNIYEFDISNNQIDEIKQIEEIDLSGLFGESGTLFYINNTLTPKIDECDKSAIYDIDRITNEIEETITFIKKELNRLQEKQIILNSKYKIAIDIDDTILQTDELYYHYWQVFLSNHLEIDPYKDYAFEDPVTQLFYDEYIHKFSFGELFDNVCECIDKLIKKGYVVDILTARSHERYGSLKKDMVELFIKNSINYNFLHLNSYHKGIFLKEHNYDLLIDNDIRNMIETNNEGIDTILFNPENIDYNYNGIQVSNWNQVEDTIELIRKKKNTK